MSATSVYSLMWVSGFWSPLRLVTIKFWNKGMGFSDTVWTIHSTMSFVCAYNYFSNCKRYVVFNQVRSIVKVERQLIWAGVTRKVTKLWAGGSLAVFSTVNCPPEDIIKHFSMSLYSISLCSCLFTMKNEVAVILEKVGGHKVYVAEAHLFYRKCPT